MSAIAGLGLTRGLADLAAQASLTTLTDWLRANAAAREAGTRACLERIRAMDPEIRAWVQVLPQAPTGKGPLSGIPFGVKDVIETKGLATEYGSPVYKGRIGTVDAAIVRDLRNRGGILLGKTQAAAFAFRDPPPTRNPRNLEHTPGGSSSGSAAAVAAGMVPFAVGTQTAGSVLRPASYCGVTGFKPTHGLLSTEGVMDYSRSCDTLGYFTHTPADMLALWQATGRPTGRDQEIRLGIPEPMPMVEPEMTTAFREAISSLLAARVPILPVDISPMLVQLVDAQRTIAYYEGARAHDQRFNEYGDRLGAVAAMVREGRQIPQARYDAARRLVVDSRARFTEMYRTTPVVLVPAATGPAPKGLSTTGDSAMNAPWSVLGTPAVSIPMPVGDRLPMGLQLTAAPGDDARVLRTAVRVYRALGGS